MDEKDIEIFRELIKTQNVTKAAENLFTTQSALTKRIQKMEEDLGCQLFIRSRRGILATPEAESILPDLITVEQTLKKVRNYTASSNGIVAGSLDVGVSINYARYRLPGILKKYMTDYPNVDIHVTADQSMSLYRKLCGGDLSIAILRGNFKWTDGDVLLSEEPVCLAISEENRKLPLSSLPYIERNTDALFVERIARWKAENGLVDHPSSLQVNDIATCLAMVSQGIGWAILPDICLKNFNGCTEPLTFKDGTKLTRSTHLLYRQDYFELPQVRLFLKAVLAYEYANSQ